MRNSFLGYVIMCVLLVCGALIVATFVRISVVALGADDFTAFMVFIVVLGIEVSGFLSIQMVLQGLMLPWIEWGLMKIPYFKDKAKTNLSVDEVPEIIIEKQYLPSLDDIRNEQRQKKANEREERLNVALVYTRKEFAPYVSDEHIKSLCSSVKLYADKLSLDTLQPIKIKDELSSIDVSHFGWNIWHYFKLGKQIDIAYFLKTVFPDVFKEMEVESIKKHLKDDELKGIIKIQKSLY